MMTESDPPSTQQAGLPRAFLIWVRAALRKYGAVPIGLFLLHTFFSRVIGLYGTGPYPSMAMHFVGGVGIAYFFYGALGLPSAKPVLGSWTKAGCWVGAFGLAGTSTVVWECAEWTTDRLGLSQAQGGLGDTMLDMALGLLGALVYLSTRLRAKG